MLFRGDEEWQPVVRHSASRGMDNPQLSERQIDLIEAILGLETKQRVSGLIALKNMDNELKD